MECGHGRSLGIYCKDCGPVKQVKDNKDYSAPGYGYTKKDMLAFAGWVYGPEIDCLSVEDQYLCKTHEGALKYWCDNVRDM